MFPDVIDQYTSHFLLLTYNYNFFFSESKDLVFSEVAFDRDQVNSSCSPCSDFFVRSWLRHKSLSSETGGESDVVGGNPKIRKIDSAQLDSAVLLRLTLVFLWKAYVVQESGQMKIVVGQHHVHVDRLNTVSVSYPIPPVVASTPPLKFTRELEPVEEPPPDPAVTTSMVSYSFSHSYQKQHCFAKGLCVVPVGLTVQNHTDTEVQVMVDSTKSPETLSSGSSSPKSVKWIGLNQATLTLGKGQSAHLTLKAGITQTGTFNLNTISVFVTFSSDQSQMVLQKHTTPSIITVVNVL